MAGHIQRHESRRTGKVTYQARIPGPNRKLIIKTFELKRDAERWLTTQASAIHSGDWIDPRRASTRFSALVEVWERTRCANLAPRTQERYAGILRNYLLPEFGAVPLSRLDRPMIKMYFTDLDASAATARKIQIVLSSVLSEAVELGYLRENPAARLRLPTPPRRQMTVLTEPEIRALAEAIEHPSDRLAVYVAAYTGIRAGEEWALQRRHIDLGGHRLIVERTLTSQSGNLLFRNATKTEGSRRVISLPTFLVNMLDVHLATIAPDPDALVFTGHGGANGRATGEGGPVRHELFVARIFKPARSALPPEKQAITWHSLRHTCASILIHHGASVLLISKRLGHASATTTLDRYSHLFPSAEAAMADALDVGFNAANDTDNVTPIDRGDQVA